MIFCKKFHQIIALRDKLGHLPRRLASLTSDAGVLSLRKVKVVVGVIRRLVKVLRDGRHQSYGNHPYEDLVRQRVFQIACEDKDPTIVMSSGMIQR